MNETTSRLPASRRAGTDMTKLGGVCALAHKHARSCRPVI